MSYEMMKQMLVTGAFGTMIGLWIWGYGYWIVSFIRWMKKKVHQKKHPETEIENQE